MSACALVAPTCVLSQQWLLHDKKGRQGSSGDVSGQLPVGRRGVSHSRLVPLGALPERGVHPRGLRSSKCNKRQGMRINK